LTRQQAVAIPTAGTVPCGDSLASTDVNNDGVFDLITGTAQGADHVKVFDGQTGALLHSFLAFGGYAGGIDVAGGDVNGDRFADLIVGAGPSAGPHVKVSDGKTGQEIRSFFAYDPGFSGKESLMLDIVLGVGGQTLTHCGRTYTIMAAGVRNGEPYADVEPHSPAVVSAVLAYLRRLLPLRSIQEIQKLLDE
jgi:hypothetical protein